MSTPNPEQPATTPRLCERCKALPAQEPHTCPYAEDIHNDSKTLCTCCTNCEHECAMDI